MFLPVIPVLDQSARQCCERELRQSLVKPMRLIGHSLLSQIKSLEGLYNQLEYFQRLFQVAINEKWESPLTHRAENMLMLHERKFEQIVLTVFSRLETTPAFHDNQYKHYFNLFLRSIGSPCVSCERRVERMAMLAHRLFEFHLKPPLEGVDKGVEVWRNLERVVHDLRSMRQLYENSLTAAEKSDIDLFLPLLKEGVKHFLSRRLLHHGAHHYFDAMNSIINLSTQGCVWISGGTKQHAVVYTIRRSGESAYRLDIFNTGEASCLHESKKGELKVYPLTYHLERETALNPSLLQYLLELPSCEMQKVLDSITEVTKAPVMSGKGVYPQVNGSCSFSCVMFALKNLFKERGLYLAFRVFQFMQAAKMMRSQIRDQLVLNELDRVIDEECRTWEQKQVTSPFFQRLLEEFKDFSRPFQMRYILRQFALGNRRPHLLIQCAELLVEMKMGIELSAKLDTYSNCMLEYLRWSSRFSTPLQAVIDAAIKVAMKYPSAPGLMQLRSELIS